MNSNSIIIIIIVIIIIIIIRILCSYLKVSSSSHIGQHQSPAKQQCRPLRWPLLFSRCHGYSSASSAPSLRHRLRHYSEWRRMPVAPSCAQRRLLRSSAMSAICRRHSAAPPVDRCQGRCCARGSAGTSRTASLSTGEALPNSANSLPTPPPAASPFPDALITRSQRFFDSRFHFKYSKTPFNMGSIARDVS